MIYYYEADIPEHMLYISEIALDFKILSTSLGPHTSLMSNILKNYTKKIADYKQLYYHTSKGMSKVYPKKIYQNAIKEFMLNNELKSFTTNKITINDKTYNFICDVDYIKNKLKIN